MKTTHALAAAMAALAGVATAQAQQQSQVPAVQEQRAVTPPAHAGAQTQPRALRAGALTQQDRRFMQQAAHSGHLEVIAGKLALTQAGEPAVREFGERLMQDHMAANRQLEQIALGRQIQLPSRPSQQQMQLVSRLQGLRGAEFDRVFVEQVGVQSHRDAVRLFERQAGAEGADRALRNFARATLPTLRRHLEMAQSLQASRGGAAATAAAGAAGAAGARAVPALEPSRPAGVDHEQLSDARELVSEAVQVVQRMKSDPQMGVLLQRARGVFILPSYGRAALGVGVQGGEGVLVTRGSGGFSDPVFYNLGGISVGPQAGAAGGELALLLMTERAVQQFRSDRQFSISADAGLVIVDYSRRGQASTGKVEDVVVWSGTQGLYAGVSFGLTGVMVDGEANRAYYARQNVSPLEILAGRVENPHNNVLGRVLGV